jgi:hypothetical protein
VIGEVNGGGGRGAPRGESNDVASPGANRITKIASQSAPPRRIWYELVLQDSETRAATIEVKDLTHNRIDAPENVASADPVAVSIDSDEASPGSIITAVENHRGRAGIHDRIGPASEEQPFEATRYRTQSRRTTDFSQLREGGRKNNCQHR